MAGRPPKEGIDYAGWSVDMFENDPKIDKLLDAQGACGFLVYFYLCLRAYGSNGYFYRWSYDDVATTARKIGGGVGSETVKNTVGLCLQIGLFDKRLFDRDGILTSRGIQKRYWQVAKERTVNLIKQEYWLLNEEESAGLDSCALKNNYAGSKLNYEPPKSNYDRQKESKGKESNLYTEIISYLNEKAGTGYRSTSKKTRSLIDARIREGFGISDFRRVIDNKVADWNHPPREGREDMRPYLRPETLFGTKFESYLNQRGAEEGEERRWRRLD